MEAPGPRSRLRAGGLLPGVAALFLLAASSAFGAQKTPEEYGKDLLSEDRDTRREAAYQLSQMGTNAEPALPQLIQALEDEQQQVWFGAVTALANLGPAAAPAAPALIKDLESWQPFRRGRTGAQGLYRTAYALGRIGPAAFPALTNALRSGEWHARAGAAMALGFMGGTARPAIPLLVDNLGHSRAEVREAAAETLGGLGKEAVDAVLAAFEKADETTKRVATAEALRRMGSAAKHAAPALRAAVVGVESPETRIAALNAFLRVEPDAASVRDLLLRAWRDETEAVRDAAGQALILQGMRDPEVGNAIVQSLRAPDAASRERAAALIAELGPRVASAAPELLRILWVTPKEEQGIFVRAFASMGPRAVALALDELRGGPLTAAGVEDHWTVTTLRGVDITAKDTLVSSLKDPHPAVRYGALAGLQALGEGAADSAGAIAELMSDPDPAVRGQAWVAAEACGVKTEALMARLDQALADGSVAALAAVRSISSRGEDARPAVSKLVQLLSSDSEALRFEAIRGLGRFGIVAAAAVGPLGERLGVAMAREQALILESLGAIGRPASGAIDAVLALSESEDPGLRRRAMLAVRGMGQDAKMASDRIEKRLKDGDGVVRAAALEALAAVDPEGQPLVEAAVAALRDSDPETRVSALGVITRLEERGRPAEKELFAMLARDEQREKVVDALRAVHPESVESLVGILEHRDWTVREMAVDCLARLGNAASAAIPALEKVADNDAHEGVKRAARRALRRLRDS